MTDRFSELFRHNLWANLRLLDMCEPLDDDQLDHSVVGTYGSIRDSWVHLVSAEGGYVALLNERQPHSSYSSRTPFTGWEDLRERVRGSGEALITIAEDFDGSRLLHERDGDAVYTYPAVVPLLQALNHATEHRVHIATILSQLGVEPPNLDGWKYGGEELDVT